MSLLTKSRPLEYCGGADYDFSDDQAGKLGTVDPANSSVSWLNVNSLLPGARVSTAAGWFAKR